jgi:hypothetical protein
MYSFKSSTVQVSLERFGQTYISSKFVEQFRELNLLLDMRTNTVPNTGCANSVYLACNLILLLQHEEILRKIVSQTYPVKTTKTHFLKTQVIIVVL